MVINRADVTNIKRPWGTLKKYLIKTQSKKNRKLWIKRTVHCSVLQYALNLQNGKDYSKKKQPLITWDDAVLSAFCLGKLQITNVCFKLFCICQLSISPGVLMIGLYILSISCAMHNCTNAQTYLQRRQTYARNYAQQCASFLVSFIAAVPREAWVY